MRVVLVLMDGLADRRWPVLGGKTPLEAAHTPNLDKLAASGLTGLMYPVGRGYAPSSEMAHFAIFGYPMELYPGRGVFEARGHGLDANKEDVVIHALFTSVVEENGGVKVVERPTPIDDEKGRRMLEDVGEIEAEGLSVRAVYTGKNQGIIFVKGGGAREITDSDPYYLEKPVSMVRPVNKAADRDAAERTAKALTRFLEHTYRILDTHPINAERRAAGKRPANFLITKWPGRKRDLPTFKERNGYNAASVCSYPLYRGLVKELGMSYFDAPNNPDPKEDLAARLVLAEKALEEGYDFIHVHSKATDDAGHEKDPELKKRVIEGLDEACARLFEPPFSSDDCLVIVTGDHATPSGTDLLHSGDPVPILMVGRNAWADGVKEFGETACLTGGLGQMTGFDFMPTVLNLTDRIRYMGSTLTPDETAYEPRDLPAFKLRGTD